ncbi:MULTISPECIES: GNAT family N-acetyltransferase [Shewanella]|uniref:GNAT family N-acetyltransferase n=1 Tax=Shewanella TaxID=22 RepID=UPI001CBA64D6|nr:MULTISPECIES: GNAT family N-acetyltransferase [Shewanella]
MFTSELKVEFSASISLISAYEWNALMFEEGHAVNPFICHAYLLALEKSGCVCAESGWIPMHLSVEYQGRKIAVMPLYNKSHSYGEYIFDWAWADAYERNHIAYYPKLLSAVPFTPVSGKRFGIEANLTEQESSIATEFIVKSLNKKMSRGEYSSWHCLFLPLNQQKQLDGSSSMTRTNNQFHWRNRNYQHFDDFLAAMSSRKRKNIIKERQKALSHDYRIRFISGLEVTDKQWQAFHYCYQLTYAKRSGHYGYLNLAFFKQLGQTMPAQIQLLVVEKPMMPISDSELGSLVEHSEWTLVAAALYFTSETHLYGRYWGCLEEADALHFEACYYQGIEYCIKHGLQTFDAGAQGEHKIARGFEPVMTYSNHHIAHPAFREAIEDFLLQETKQNRRYMTEAAKLLPFKKKE